MPETIPKWILVKKGIDTMGTGVKLILRAILVAMIWLVILPYFTIWIWRLYFWVGDWFAFSANGLAVPVSETNATVSRNVTELLLMNPKALEHMDTLTRLVHRTIPQEYKGFSKFILDCFEGQVISAVVVVVFVAIFLLREWVNQNQDPEEDVLVEVPGRPDGLQLDEAEVEGALGRLLAAQLQRQQQEAAARAAELANDLAAHRDPAFDLPAHRNPGNARPNPQDAWRNNAFDFDEHNDRRPPELNDAHRYPSHEIFPVGGESSTARAGYIYDPLNQTYHPDSPWVQGSSSSHHGHGMDSQTSTGQEPSDTNNGEGSSTGRRTSPPERDNIIRAKNMQPLYWTEGIRLTYDNVFLRPDGSEMTTEEKLARYEDLCQSVDLSFADGVRLLEWRTAQAEAHMEQMNLLRADMTIEERLEHLLQLEHGARIMEEQRDALLPHASEGLRHILPYDDNLAQAHDDIFPSHPAAAPPLAPVPAPRPAAAAPLRAHVQPPPPPPPAPAPAPAVVMAAQNDELDDMNVEELDGILEVIGMRGSYWLLLQNSLLMSALICASLGLGVWVPYMLGKTMVLMNPLNILHIPLRILSNITDPITDFLLDRIMPMLAAIISKPLTAISTQISPYVSPLLGSYLGGRALKPLEDMLQEHVMPIWRAVVEEATAVAPVQTQETIAEMATEVPIFVNAPDFTGGAVLFQQLISKWNNVAYGGSSNDKFLAIAVGYAIMFALASWYMKRTQPTYRNSIGKAVRSILREQGLILKASRCLERSIIAFFVAIEMVVFPLFCGIVVAVTTLPVLPGATLGSRWAFYQQSPNWSIIMHWLVGTAFMFNFSVFVSICRGVVRPGVMWFIRDPNDEGFHPVREILERSVLVQLRKLGTGAMMYLTLIVLGVSMTTHAVHLVINGAFPLRWPIDEPISDLPVDLLLFHLIVPFTFQWLNPQDRFKALFVGWWRKLAQLMRLSSFMYGKDGERYPEEEGYIVYRSWKAWLLRYRPPIPGLDSNDADTIGSGEELDIDAPVLFVRDGGLYRVPNTDRVIHLKNRRVLVPVDAEGRALDPKEDLPGEIDPLMEIQPRGREPRLPIDPKEGTVVVYAPPNFKRRLISFIVLIWTTTMSFLAISVVVPLILGRSLFTLVTERQVHDVYSFAAGVYAIGALWYVQEWTLSTYQSLSSAGGRLVDVPDKVKMVVRAFKITAKLVYFAILLGFVFPLGLGLMMEVFIIIPIKAALYGDTGTIFAFSWASGLLWMKLGHRILTEDPNSRFSIDMDRIFPGMDVEQWNVGYATRRFVFPALGLFIFGIATPAILAWTVADTTGLQGTRRATFFRLAYPTMLLVCMLVLGCRESVAIMKGWSQYVRDQEYLVGRRLHNLTQEEEEADTVEAEGTPEQRVRQQQQQQQQQQPEGEEQGQRPGLEMNETAYGQRRWGRERSRQGLAESDDDDAADDDGVPDLEPAQSMSSLGQSQHQQQERRDAGYPNKYGIESSSAVSRTEAFGAFDKYDVEDEEEGEWDDENEGGGTEGTIAGRTRSRRHERLQTIRGSHDDR
ncbi:hypothetical protein BGZ99_005746 [Dissophora globulifera]|uniref:RING-type E3 ubiquitin transferase n=1 Tax=Dissophora globulifera TaxID=979702 RepID=A0A9P6USY1_9FUNG|nr:hypothetical protein BGZ99_005746 [Dissophora globulifera]